MVPPCCKAWMRVQLEDDAVLFVRVSSADRDRLVNTMGTLFQSR